MLLSKYRFSLDIKLTQSQVSIPVMLNDTIWGFYINLIDNGKPLLLPDGCRAVFVAKKPDGNTLFNDCIIEGNHIIRYDFTANTTNVEGIVPCEIRVYTHPSGRMLTCPRFTMVVDHRVILDDEIVLSESEHTTLDSIIASEYARQQAELERANVAERAEEAVVKAENALKAAEGKMVSHSWNGTVLTLTSMSGTSSADLKGEDGKDGKDGKGFSISKIYASVTEMNAGYSSDGVGVGDFVLISTGNKDDADDGNLYVKTDTAYVYLTDMSGAQGIQGPTGKGISKIEKTSEVGLVDIYTITYTDDSTSTFTVTNGKDGIGGAITEEQKEAIITELLNRLPIAEEVSV